MRELFGLRSTNFTVTTADDSLTFHILSVIRLLRRRPVAVRREIHGRKRRRDYREILAHYYPGTELTRLGA
ncbi:MAG: hypothetical protein ACLR4Z_15240 [Butyricicoccaceae bacterium]